MQLDGKRRVVLDEQLRQAQRSDLAREGGAKPAVFGKNQLRAAAPDVDHQDATRRMRPNTLDAQVDQSRLLLAGDHLDRNAKRRRGVFEKLRLIAGVPNRCGRHRARGNNVIAAEDGGHAGQHGANDSYGFRADEAASKDALAEPRHFAFGGQRLGRLARHEVRDQQPNRIASDIDSGVSRH